MRVNDCAASLMEMSNSDMFRLIQNHFNTHNTLPGNKNLKDTVWAAIQEFGNEFPEDVDPYLAEHSRGEQPFTKDQIVREFASARIQQTNIAGVKDQVENTRSTPNHSLWNLSAQMKIRKRLARSMCIRWMGRCREFLNLGMSG